jgi:hypothetical protein
MRENQESVEKWATDTFGVDASDASVAVRANMEFIEFLQSCTAGAGKPDVVELGDTVIVLFRLASRWGLNIDGYVNQGRQFYSCDLASLVRTATRRMGIVVGGAICRTPEVPTLAALISDLNEICLILDHKLGEVIDAKMVINRRRQWHVVDGHGFHKHAPEGDAA